MPDPPGTSDVGGDRPWVWAPRLDPTCGEYGVYATRLNSLDLPAGSSEIAITGARIILNNNFAPMPVAGHTYASAQFIGRGPTEFSFQMTGIGDEKFADIQSMMEELEKNAREFRRIKGAARVYFLGNEFLKLAGIEDGIISEFDTETGTAPGGTNRFAGQISFTSDGHHTEGFQQEAYYETEILSEILSVMLNRITVRVVNGNQFDESYVRAITGGVVDTVVGTAAAPIAPVGPPALSSAGVLARGAVGGIIEGLDLAVRTLRGSSPDTDLTSASGIAETIRAESAFVIQAGRLWWTSDESSRAVGGEGLAEDYSRAVMENDLLRAPIITPIIERENTGALYEAQEQPGFEWLNSSLRALALALFTHNLSVPAHTFFQGPLRGLYYVFSRAPSSTSGEGESLTRTSHPRQGRINDWPPTLLASEDSDLARMMHGRRHRWATSSQIVSNLQSLESAVIDIARALGDEHMGHPDFESVFPGIAERWAESRSRTVHPTYPDLELPAHPATGEVLDTEPDFYYFNDSEEGMINEIGPDLIQEMDARVDAMEHTFTRLNNGQEWNDTYLGRSRIGPDTLSDTGALQESIYPMDGAPGSMEIDHAAEDREHRVLGGGPESREDSVVDAVMALSPGIRSSADTDVSERRRQMLRNTAFALPPGGAERDPAARLSIGPVDDEVESGDRSHSFARNSIRSLVQQAVAQNPDETLTMRRGFPSFKIYFIEDDIGAQRAHLLPSAGTGLLAGTRPVMFFDDLYNYNSVKSIRLIRSRKNPTDLLVLSLTNVAGLLERRRWNPRPGERQQELYRPGFEDTERENPLKKIIMKEGLKVQARLGYTNNPDNMGIKFIGEVVEVSYNAECSDEVTVICQSYGSELVLESKGATTDGRTDFIDTPDVVHTLMCSPELAHFGRFSLNPQFNPAEARTVATSRGEGSGSVVNWEMVEDRAREVLARNRSKWILANNPADDNIYAPSIRDYLGWWERHETRVGDSYRTMGQAAERAFEVEWSRWSLMFGARHAVQQLRQWGAQGITALGNYLSATDYQTSGATIWETLKEMELRHPGWVAHPRPYGTRMTLFFGVPDHRYWADEISPQEMLTLSRFRGALDRSNSVTGAMDEEVDALFAAGPARPGEPPRTVSLRQEIAPGIGSVEHYASYIIRRTQREITSNILLADAGAYIGRTMGRYRPFRRHHLITSEHHLLMNNIRASEKNTFNCVTVNYAGGASYTIKADDSIPDEKLRTQIFNYPTCNSEDLARRYCIGLLQRHLKDVYKGEIVTIGMDIDPYDVVFLSDKRSGMYGGFEVEQVVDTFTPQTGWITEITPDMIVGTNEWSTSTTRAAREVVLGRMAQRMGGTAAVASLGGGIVGGIGALAVANPIAGAAVAIPVAAGAALAWTGGYYLVQWTQDRQPIWICPLILGERPFFSGLDGFRQDGLFASIRGRIHRAVGDVEEGWRVFHLGGFANDFTVTLAQSIAGQSGA